MKIYKHWLFPFSFIVNYREPEESPTGNLFNIFYSIILISAIVLLFVGCKKESLGEVGCNATGVRWGVVEQIAVTNCGTLSSGCHSSVSPAFNFTYENSLKEGGNILQRIALSRSDDKRMPPGGEGLSDCDIEKIRDFYKEGAKK